MITGNTKQSFQLISGDLILKNFNAVEDHQKQLFQIHCKNVVSRG